MQCSVKKPVVRLLELGGFWARSAEKKAIGMVRLSVEERP
jgi:hypothetical protein